ncbi:hypothetical protein [Ralstonia pseudosolanacearum]|uniref:hypothetical protein n=1 Tax=Ralstonia pseudosolanacearum TaxID=1310165 RepID=UPI0018D0279B|nr:hypothetical protein [Ralstonia pseudosolanacearum]
MYELRAKEPVPATFAIGVKDAERFSHEFRSFQDYGGTLEFENIDFSMKGSPLFPGREVACTRLQLATQQHAITLSLAVGKDLSFRCDFSGKSTGGVKGIAFTGEAFGGLMTAKLTADFSGRDARLTLSSDFRPWATKPVARLPHFARVAQFIEAIGREHSVAVSMESGGIEAELGLCSLPEGDFFPALNAFLYELRALRELDAFFGLGLVVPQELDDVMHTVKRYSEVLSLIGIHKADTPEISMKVTPRAEQENEASDYANIESAIETRRPMDFLLTQEVTLSFGGKSFGPYVVELSCPQALVNTVGPVQFKAGVPKKLSLRPAEGYQWSARNGGPLTTYAGPASTVRS